MQRLFIILTTLLCLLSFSATGQASASSVEGISAQAQNGGFGDCSRSMPDDHGEVLWSETCLHTAVGYSSIPPQPVIPVVSLLLVLNDIRGPPAK